MTSLKIAKKNEVHLTVDAEPHVQQELSDYFTFDVPGAKFMPQYRNRHWDGKIRLFSTATGEVYVGLLDKIISWARKSDYNVEFIDNYEENIENTISLHRKKQSNTLYTINALNQVIRSKNNGVLDKRFNVNWEEYQNTLLLTNETGLNVVPTKIFQIINVTDWNK